MSQLATDDQPAEHPGELRRFVILHHTGFGREHWDLMLEEQHALASWRLYQAPETLAIMPQDVEQQADHRKLYLDYEGPVSGGRGTVRCVARGTCVLISADARQWRFVLQAPPCDGAYCLQHLQGNRWRLTAAGP